MLSAIIIVVFMLFYLIIVKPYSSSLSKILSLVNEVLLLICLLITVRFLDPVISPTVSLIYGQLLITIILMTIAINWIGIIISGIISLIQSKVNKKKMKEMKIENNEISLYSLGDTENNFSKMNRANKYKSLSDKSM